MKFLILFIAAVLSFSYELMVLTEKDSQTLKNIGFSCEKKENGFKCLSSNDINEIKRVKEFLKAKFNINSRIINNGFSDSSQKSDSVKKINGNYCIQVFSLKNLNRGKRRFKLYKDFPFARIEKIGDFYTLRVGQGKYKEIKRLNNKIKGLIRKCNISPQRIIVSNFNINGTDNKNFSSNKLLKSVRVTAKNKNILLKQMYQYLNSGDLTSAKKLALQLKNSYPNDAGLVLGLISMKKENFKNACYIFSSLHTSKGRKLKKDACYTYFIKKGYQLIDTSPKQAFYFFSKALRYKPNDKNAIMGKGYVYINLKKYKQAYKIFKQLHNKYPKDKKVLEGYVNVLYLLKKDSELEALRKSFGNELKEEFSSIDFYMDLKKSNLLIKEKKYDEAEKILIKLYPKKPDDINLLLTFANLYFKTNQLNRALDFYKNVLVISPNNFYALKAVEIIYMKKGEYKEALKYSNKITALGFKDKDRKKIEKFYYIELANEEIKENKLEEAKKLLKQLYAKDKKNALILSLLGDIAFKEKRDNLAYLYYAKSYAAEPGNFGIKLKFLYALLKLNLFDQINIILIKTDTSSLNDEQKILLKKFYISLYSKYASYLLNHKKYKEALSVVNNGLLMDENNYTLLSVKAWICLKLKKYKCAKKEFELALKEKDDDGLKYGLALVYLNLGNQSKAETILDSIKSDDKELRLKMADAYIRIGETDKAKHLLSGIESHSGLKEPLKLNKKTEHKKFFYNPFLDEINYQEKEPLSLEDNKKKTVLKKSVLQEYKALQKKIAQIEQNYISNVKLGFKIRNKSGEKGTSQLTRLSFPYLAGEYFIKNKKLVFNLNTESLDSKDGNTSLKNTKVKGIGGKIGLETKNFQIHVGTTLLGTDISPTIVGDVSFNVQKKKNHFYLKLYRDSFKDTLTSYVGNEINGTEFSRVIANGLKLGYKKDLDKNGSFLYTDISFNLLNGDNIDKNSNIEMECLYLNYIGNDFLDKNFLGFYLNFAHYNNNHYIFAPPYGGYFSPKLFLSAMPRYEGYLYSDDKKFISKLTLMIGSSYIDSWKEKTADFAYDISYNLEYLFLKRTAIEGGIDIRNSTNYNDMFFTLTFRYYFGNKQFFTDKDIDSFSEKVVNW